jgi:hypothetical protein
MNSSEEYGGLMFLIILLSMPIASAYYPGYEVPGNHSMQERVMSKIPSDMWVGLSRIMFVKDDCVKAIDYFKRIDDDTCYAGYFDAYWSKTTITMYQNLGEEDMEWLLLHELQHLRQWREGRKINEEEADNFADDYLGVIYG